MASRSRADTSSPKSSEPAPPHERQARRRLIGAAALALVVGMLFSVFFDAEPRRVRDDVQVRIPSRDAAGSGAVQPSGATSPAAPSTSTAVAEAPPADPTPSAAGSPLGQGTEPRGAAVAEAPPAGQAVSEPAPPAPAPVASAQAPKADEAAAAPKADAVARPPAKAARAEGKTEGKTGGYYLQVGAFASEKAASDQVERIKRLGATAFKESIRTQQGERIRVRLGPYPTREASDPVRNRLRAAGIDVTLVAP